MNPEAVDKHYFDEDLESSGNPDDFGMLTDDECNDIAHLDMPGFGRMSWRQFCDLNFDNMKDIFFRDIESAEKFYSYYFFVKGFGTRKQRKDLSKSKLDKDKGLVVSFQFVCSKSGYALNNSGPRVMNNVEDLEKRQKDTGIRGFRLSKCGCKAGLKLKYLKYLGLYAMSEFVPEHQAGQYVVSSR